MVFLRHGVEGCREELPDDHRALTANGGDRLASLEHAVDQRSCVLDGNASHGRRTIDPSPKVTKQRPREVRSDPFDRVAVRCLVLVMRAILIVACDHTDSELAFRSNWEDHSIAA